MEGAKRCASLLLSPSCEVFDKVKKRLENCDVAWLHEFLTWQGLTHLLDTLQLLGQSRDGAMVSDNILQLNGALCLREVLNHRVGLEYLTERPALIDKLVLGTARLA